MKFKIKDLWKTKHQRILDFAAIANLILLSYISGDYSIGFFISALVYMLVTLFIAQVISIKKVTALHYFFLGGLIPIIYNSLGLILGWFEIPNLSTFIVLGALQQGAITFVIAKILKVK